MASSRAHVQKYTSQTLGPVEDRGFGFYAQKPSLNHKAKGILVCPDDRPPQHGHMSYNQQTENDYGTYAEVYHTHPTYGKVYGSIVSYSHLEHNLGPLVD